MNRNTFFQSLLSGGKTHALPILSFPAARKLQVSVRQLLHSAELQANAMELVAHSTDTVAAVSFMDLSLEAEAFGATVVFRENEIPAITGQLISDGEEAAALQIPDLTAGRIPIAIETIRLAKEKVTEKPVFAGMIGPFSLAGRLMDVTEILYTCFDEPEAVHEVLQKATAFLKNYASALKTAGADGMILAEPLCGILSPDMAEEFSCPYVKEIIDSVQTEDFAVIYHNCGNSVPQMAKQLYGMNAAAYHFGNAVDLYCLLQDAPADVLLMGNIDPVSCFAKGTREHIREQTLALLDQCGPYRNFILSSGCDIPYTAPWENVESFFGALAEYNQAH